MTILAVLLFAIVGGLVAGNLTNKSIIQTLPIAFGAGVGALLGGLIGTGILRMVLTVALIALVAGLVWYALDRRKNNRAELGG